MAMKALSVETTPNTLNGVHELPQLNTGKTTVADIAKASAEAYFGSAKTFAIGPSELKTRISDNNDQVTYLIIDVRSPELYAKGISKVL